MATPRIKLDTKGLQKLMQTEPEKVEKWLDGEAEHMVSDIKLSMNTSPPGRSYTRGGVTHVASQPGQPPNIDIGTLINSIRWERHGTFTRHIMDGVTYGLPLEDGTESIAPRPFMRPAFERERSTIEQSARDNLGLENI